MSRDVVADLNLVDGYVASFVPGPDRRSDVVANGASELLLEVFGDCGAHARSALGVSQVPFGCCVEIEMVVDVSRSDSSCEM
jgi:enamine deaminase RidA (YjgF/YER057c/UK114 family)